MSSPLVSVIMPVYNSALYLKEAVDSILNQTYTNLELICVDDCSKDESVVILKSISDSRLKIISLEKNGGVANARNTGINRAKGEFISFLDSDDIAFPHRIEIQVEYLIQHPEADAVFGRVKLVDVYGNPCGTWEDDELYILPKEINERLPVANCVSQPAAMVRKSALPTPVYHHEYKDSEDWGLWLEMIATGKSLHKIDEPLTYYRIRPSSETQRSNKHPLEKLIRFRETYLSLKIEGAKNVNIEKILRAQITEEKKLLRANKFIYKPLSILKKVFLANPIWLVVEHFRLVFFIKSHSHVSVFLFFPFYHIGGAEKVHAAIAQLNLYEMPMIFITKKSGDKGFLSAFKKRAYVFDMWKLAWFPFFKNITARAIAHHINGKKFPVVISSNSAFFYETLKYLDSHVKCVDLIHAFVHPEESGPEKWSLPYVNKLQQRVFIGQKAMDEMAQLYAKENLPSNLTSRFKLIRNYVEIPGNFIHNGITGTARLIYIGRGTPEKRVHLAAKISAKHRENSEAAPISMIGNMHNAIESDDLVHCDLIGVIQEEEEVYRHLLRSDILLLTSSREGFPMAIAEAMACGVIPITTAVGDIPNVIQDGVNGFLLPAVGETEIIDKAIEIIHLLESNPSLTIRIREQARKDAESMFSKDNFVESWNKVLTYQ